MHKIILAIIAMSVVSGCVTAGQKSQKSMFMREDMDQAQNLITKADHQICIDSYIKNMHDPSSFELAGEFFLDEIATRYSYGRTWDYGPERRVVYSARARGRNAYGGLVLSKMQCIFGVYDGGIEFWRAENG